MDSQDGKRSKLKLKGFGPERTDRMFTLRIETDNAAFSEGNLGGELARILRDVAARLERSTCYDAALLFDVNGNSVGNYELEVDRLGPEARKG